MDLYQAIYLVPGTGLEPASREAADFKSLLTVWKHRLLTWFARRYKASRGITILCMRTVLGRFGAEKPTPISSL